MGHRQVGREVEISSITSCPPNCMQLAFRIKGWKWLEVLLATPCGYEHCEVFITFILGGCGCACAVAHFGRSETARRSVFSPSVLRVEGIEFRWSG